MSCSQRSTRWGPPPTRSCSNYHAVRESGLGYSVLEFRQTLTVGPHTATFDCVATIIWKQTIRGWREARWHASVISSVVPDELKPAA